MDIFSSIKNVQQPTYDKNISNVKDTHHQQIQNSNIQQQTKEKDPLEGKSKEEIKKELQKVTQELNEAMNPLNINLEFKYNQKVDELVVQVVDKSNDRVIREFPPKEALKLMEKMRELVGMLFDKKG